MFSKKDLLWFLSLSYEADDKFIDMIKNEKNIVLENKGNEISVEAYSKACAVAMEIHAMKMFIRFNLSAHGILYSNVDVKNKIELILLRFFSKRFPDFVVVISSSKGSFVKMPGYHTIRIFDDKLEDVVKSLESVLPKKEELTNLEEKKNDIWRIFYNSQYIDSRENYRLFNHNIPKRLRDSGVVNDQNLLMKRISDY